MSDLKQTITDYVTKTRVSALATTREDGAPVVRAIGGFAPDGLDILFSTADSSAKVSQIRSRPWVTFYFQHDGQEIPTFKYVSLVGKAGEVKGVGERDQAIQILSARNPRFKARAEKGELGNVVIYRVKPTEIRFVDLAKGPGAAEVLKL